MQTAGVRVSEAGERSEPRMLVRRKHALPRQCSRRARTSFGWLRSGDTSSAGGHRHAIARAVAVAHEDLASRELDVLHPHQHTLHDAHAGAVREPARQAVCAAHPHEHPGDLVVRRHGRRPHRRLRTPGTTSRVSSMPGTSRSRNSSARFARFCVEAATERSTARKEGRGLHVPPRQARRGPLAMAEHEASNPVDVRLLGVQAVVLDADPAPHPVRHARGTDVVHEAGPIGPTTGARPLDSPQVSRPAASDE